MGNDIIKNSFKVYQESEPVDEGGFHVESMNKCIDEAHQLPPLVPLYPEIVLEGDLSIIFGQSGIGKTIFAMQIARHIAENGKRLLYVDCEMTPRQLGNRYETANFPPTFLRAEMDREYPAEDVLNPYCNSPRFLSLKNNKSPLDPQKSHGCWVFFACILPPVC